ncbi:MAG: hypothetical protein DSY83_08840 [Flavobacteriia bacterium]|nr:MAG: hypothetical protein DSY83_08840 [Flavobacteriia bacterium]
MGQNWKVINKTLGIIEILLGISVIILTIYSWHTVLTQLEHFGLNWEKISFFKLIKQSHFVFLSGVLGMISGILLLKGKRWGWITSVSSFLVYSIGMILIALGTNNKGKVLLEDEGDYIIPGVLLIVFLVLTFLLALKPIRELYSIKIRDWVIVGTKVLLFTLDKLIIN